jgi:hypothetical protein
MKTREEYHVLINEAIQRLETGDTTSMILLNISNPEGGFLEIAVTQEQHRMDGWHGVFHSGKPDARYCDSTMEEVAATFESIRFDAQNLMALEEFTALMGKNFRVKKFVDKDHQFIGMSDDRLVLFHVSDDWEHVRETVGQHVSLAIN